MNPYDFVPVDWSRPPERRPLTGHDRFCGANGTIKCRITTETPIFIDAGDEHAKPKKFLSNGRKEYFIPGSSLKGVFRSIVETVGDGCWLLFDGEYESKSVNYQSKLPPEFCRCSNPEQLCVACRMFGIVNGSKLSYLGRVGFDDAVCTHPVAHKPVYTIILSNPKPRHRIWYLDGEKVTGRKFYFHQKEIQTTKFRLPIDLTKGMQNQYITPLDTNSIFEFKVNFTGLADDELAILLYALFLEPGMRHKIGYAKPAGFGTVLIRPLELQLYKIPERYYGHSDGVEIKSGESLEKFITSQTAPYINNRHSQTLNALRRIWAWQPAYGHFAYPGWDWFSKNPRTPISQT